MGGLIFELGFTESPGGADNVETQALNEHTYCCELSADMCDSGEPDPTKSSECLDFH